MAFSNKPVHFFDITCSLDGPRKSWSPNTLKTRTVLNYKGIKYTQSWVSYPDIAALSEGLKMPPTGTTIKYTLPAIVHKASITSNPYGALNDSLPIALHLEKTFPAPKYPSIFPNGQASYALAVATRKLLNAAFDKTHIIVLPKVQAMLDDRGAQYFHETRLPNYRKRFGNINSLSEVLPKNDEEYEAIWAATQKELVIFTEMLTGEGSIQGPFLEGEKPGYADFILASWLAWHERACPKTFEALLNTGNGSLRKHWVASLPYLDGQGEDKEWAQSEI
ncbi:putative glutathione S-transferase [Talaromyces proteolyticus]|uniref:Glutathione S-transferase n=1 Tax=Talaromyces proteolyticus TaxID=1131652 RepID=A0AAD4PYH2_9EURO|nr:putative glutathione S-transferase [Talaromyces proteolyticus]KAH8694076.1 putative glutathione S-transferase [Talaromyces proteolyticus]